VAEIPIQRKEGRNMWPIIIGLLALAALLWWMLSRRNDTDTVAGRADTAAVASGVTTDSAAGMTGGMAAGTAGAAAGAAGTTGTGTLADADIAVAMHEVNAGEIAAGEVAETNASNADVKAYARDMVRSHRAMDEKASKLAMGSTAAGASAIRDSIVQANKTMASQLQGAGSGANFDRAYIEGQIAAHQNTLALLQRAQGQAQNSDLKQLVTAAIPDVEKHLARARTIQSKLGQ
jgi:putative membrane protein